MVGRALISLLPFFSLNISGSTRDSDSSRVHLESVHRTLIQVEKPILILHPYSQYLGSKFIQSDLLQSSSLQMDLVRFPTNSSKSFYNRCFSSTCSSQNISRLLYTQYQSATYGMVSIQQFSSPTNKSLHMQSSPKGMPFDEKGQKNSSKKASYLINLLTLTLLPNLTFILFK